MANNFSSSPTNVTSNHPYDGACLFESIESRFDGFLFIFISCCAIVGNLTVFICYYKYKPLRRITNVYILSLSASDLLVACLTVPFSFAVFLCNLQMQLGEQEVQRMIYMICDMVPSILSIYALALVAIDRAIAIAEPFWHRKHVNNVRASITVVIMWLYVFALASFVFVVDATKFTLFIIIMVYALPVSIMIVSYLLMGCVAKRHSKELASLERTRTRLKNGGSISKKNSVTSLSQADYLYNIEKTCQKPNDVGLPLVSTYNEKESGNRISRQNSWFKSSVPRFSAARIRTRSSSLVNSIRILKRELKAATTLSLILGCFIISWTPFIALNIEYYRCNAQCIINFDLVKYFKLLHYTNSALNPLLFMLLNKRWRSAFQIVILRRAKNYHATSETSTMVGW